MEDLISNNFENKNSDKLEFDALIISHFSETRRWTMFLAVLGFIVTGLMMLAVIVMLAVAPIAGNRVFLSFIPMLLVVVIYFFPLYYLLRFSIHSKKALKQIDQSELAVSFRYQKYLYRFLGIMAIITISLYVVAGIIIAVSGVLMRR